MVSKSKTLTEFELDALNAAVDVLRDRLRSDLPFDNAERALVRWLERAKSGKRDVHSKHFWKFYRPLICKLHAENIDKVWTKQGLAYALAAQVERARLDNEPIVPSKNEIPGGQLEKVHVPNKIERILKLGLKFKD